MICRYAIVEDLYLRHKSLVTDELERALVQLYLAIMLYLSEVKSYFHQNSASQYQAVVFHGIELNYT